MIFFCLHSWGGSLPCAGRAAQCCSSVLAWLCSMSQHGCPPTGVLINSHPEAAGVSHMCFNKYCCQASPPVWFFFFLASCLSEPLCNVTTHYIPQSPPASIQHIQGPRKAPEPDWELLSLICIFQRHQFGCPGRIGTNINVYFHALGKIPEMGKYNKANMVNIADKGLFG